MTSVNPGPSTSGIANTVPLSQGLQLLFVARNVNMQSITDQQFTKVFTGNSWDPIYVIANCVSGNYNTACLGGVYPLPNKSGTGVVSSTQNYNAMASGVGTHTNCTVQATTTTYSGIPYVSLTTANAIAFFCDFFIFGFCYD